MTPLFFNPNDVCCPEIFDLQSVLVAQALQAANYASSSSSTSSTGSATSCSSNTSNNTTMKRQRRRAFQIYRIYKCDYEGCGKSYEKVSHLNTHRMLKGHGRNKSKAELISKYKS